MISTKDNTTRALVLIQDGLREMKKASIFHQYANDPGANCLPSCFKCAFIKAGVCLEYALLTMEV